MDTKEKLVELLDRFVYDEWYGNDEIADELISNGVTVQEWIPVKDRLPENDSDVLAYLRNGEESRIYPANYAKGVWFNCIFNTPVTDTTTHWMPLPEPPREG